jgi:DMSO/TMAO reductase YedYZ molybdopterin-dependent catalytic subunit
MKNLTPIAFVLLFCCCIQQSETIRELSEIEVREYQGERLSSVADFRENSIRGLQEVDVGSYRLQVAGLVDRPRNLTYAEALGRQRYRKAVRLYCVEGWDVSILWDGVLVEDLIAEAEPKPEANTVIFYAVDGYSTSLPLSYIRDRDILLAYGMNNVTLPPERGFPFQLVAEDKWGYKWIKWVNRIELSDDSAYEGYWESRGYGNSGDLDKPFF